MDTPRLNLQIPAGHPKAGRLLELSSFLASHQSYKSGITVDKTPPVSKSDAEKEMLEILKEIVPDETLQSFVQQARDYNDKVRQHSTDSVLTDLVNKTIGNPASMVQTMTAIASSGVLDTKTRELVEKVIRKASDD